MKTSKYDVRCTPVSKNYGLVRLKCLEQNRGSNFFRSMMHPVNTLHDHVENKELLKSFCCTIKVINKTLLKLIKLKRFLLSRK